MSAALASLHSAAPQVLTRARLPAWLLGPDWPRVSGEPALAELVLANGRIQSLAPCQPGAAAQALVPGTWDLDGALVLPGFVDAHVHLDKAFTLSRIRDVQPGLLGAIEASTRDLAGWTPADIAARATRGLEWAWQAGTVHLRTHVNWAEIGTLPMAWPVLAGLAEAWADRVQLQQVSLTKLDNFSRLEDARTMAAQVASTGPHALMGGFVHSTNWQPQALRHLLHAAQEHDLDVDLHVDEELNPAAQGLATAAQLLREMDFSGRVVCGHVCALAAQPLSEALATLDAVARAPITLVSLPVTNLLLQDATPQRTPRLRGITLVKEARARGIPLLFASDNVQDPFCRLGSFDPIESMLSAATVAQLDAPFDTWSDSLCRADFLQRGAVGAAACEGSWADLVIFTQADATGWPSRAGERLVLRKGLPVHGAVPERFCLSSLDQLA